MNCMSGIRVKILKTTSLAALCSSLVVVNLITKGLESLYLAQQRTTCLFTTRIVVVDQETPVAGIRNSLSKFFLVFPAVFLPSKSVLFCFLLNHSVLILRRRFQLALDLSF